MMTSPIISEFLFKSFISNDIYKAYGIVNTQTPNLIHNKDFW